MGVRGKAETCRCRRKQASLCAWWCGQTGKVSRAFFSHTAISSTGHSSHFMHKVCSLPIFFLLLDSVPASGEQPALLCLSASPDLDRR